MPDVNKNTNGARISRISSSSGNSSVVQTARAAALVVAVVAVMASRRTIRHLSKTGSSLPNRGIARAFLLCIEASKKEKKILRGSV